METNTRSEERLIREFDRVHTQLNTTHHALTVIQGQLMTIEQALMHERNSRLMSQRMPMPTQISTPSPATSPSPTRLVIAFRDTKSLIYTVMLAILAIGTVAGHWSLSDLREWMAIKM